MPAAYGWFYRRVHTVSLPRLTRWGLSPDADLVFRAVLMLGPRPGHALAGRLNMPVPRVAASLEELAAEGVVRHDPATDTWRALSGPAALALIRGRRLKVIDAERSGRGHIAVTRSLVDAAPQMAVRHLRNRADARRRIAELAAVEKHEHLAMHIEQAFSAESWAAASPLDLALLARGVRLRTLCPPDMDDTPPAEVPDAVRCGLQDRRLPEIPTKLMIFDRRVALVAVDPGNLDRGFWEVTEPAIVDTFVALFAAQWARATPPRPKEVTPVVLTPREKALITLLAQGHTDASAARELGLSPRSVTYTLRALMDRLGVENRFQLGLALGALKAAPIPGELGPDEGKEA